jgi:hypothetical protein
MSPTRTAVPPPRLTAAQSARIDAMSDECTVVGVHEGCPLVRLGGGGDVALLESDGRLALAQRRIGLVDPHADLEQA